MTIRVPSGAFAVTGASGQLGSRLAVRLAGQGARQRLIVRDAAHAPRLASQDLPDAEIGIVPGYADLGAMTAAFEDIETVVLVSVREAPDRVADLRTAVNAAVRAGVQRLVYLSTVGAAPDAIFTSAREHANTEADIRESGLRWTFLRDSFYYEGLLDMVGTDGVIRGPAGSGRIAAVAYDDVADVATAVLLDEDPTRHDGRAYDVTGPQALTLYEVAEHIGRACGRPIEYRPETVSEAYRSRAEYDVPAFVKDAWVSTYTAIAAGAFARVSDVVARFAGRPALGLADWLAEHPAEYARLLPGS